MRSHLFFGPVLLLGLFFSCQDSALQDTLSGDEQAYEKSSVIAVNEIMIESAVEEGAYEAGFYSETEALLKQIGRVNGRSHHLMDWDNADRYIGKEIPNVTISTTDSTVYPVTITIDYGDSTVLKNGKVVSGTIIVEISASKRTDGATRTTTYQDYTVDSVSVNGAVLEAYQVTGDSVMTKTLSGQLKVVLADGTVIDRTESKTRTWLSGLDTTKDPSDDTIQVTGRISATSSAGESYEQVITIPLIKTGECRHYVSGEVSVTQNGEVLFVLNYGDGTCDNVATLTVQGESSEIELTGSAHSKKPKVGHKHKK